MRNGREWGQPWSAAVLAPWRGTGASLVTATAGALIDAEMGPKGQDVVLMDADLETAGLTSLLGAWRTSGSCEEDCGLVGFAKEEKIALHDRTAAPFLVRLRAHDGRSEGMTLFSGLRGRGSSAFTARRDLPDIVGRAAESLAEIAGCLLVDCGTGWGPCTRRVCDAVEYVFLVGPPDGRPHPAVRELTAELERAGLLGKLAGYVANRPGPGPRFTGQNRLNGVGGARSRDTLPVRTVLDLPEDPRAAQTVAQGALPGPQSPFGKAFREGLEALEPDLFRTGFGPGGH
ncbi:hypothetical protein IAG44_30780 [Streptomyces roseirectus]|uniref:CobQ/CobB/MinD/ParA nucleotide binding domain-containing protein n=1 Tax=Streptomyces roseirectus TaxID=2768066 RepID=A0A7H0IKT6_9ACTN|nr:hypothetical protein [Streptomyces roseirectus]QNP73402.1 hypothetical protein IAG44_30780 [Streptomyces roseirectus]